MVEPPIRPMLAKRVEAVPGGDGWMYEPKWDGFRAIAFREGAGWTLQSRDLKPLERYFPELRAPLLSALPEGAVVDGEVVIATDEGLDFDALLQRIHPAASRVDRLASATPASMVIWDLLALGGEDLRGRPFAERRARLEEALFDVGPPLYLTPVTRDRQVAVDWFERFEGAGLDGVIAKREDGSYEPGKRAMFKIKHERTADCVVAGFRWHKGGAGERVGSLLLGLYDAKGTLHHVGVVSSFSAVRRAELMRELAPLRERAKRDHPWGEWMQAEARGQRVPGGPSRWSRDKNLAWEPLLPELVVEVAYDHMQGDRFRHTAQFRRWRPDKPPRECTYEQLEVKTPVELSEIFGAGR